MQDLRWEPRSPKTGPYSLTWKSRDGMTYSADGQGVDLSKSGARIECAREIKPGTLMYIESQDGVVEGECVVVHCTRRGAMFHLGVEFRDEMEGKAPRPDAGKVEADLDYYDILQISPKADIQTIHRVFRIMAARFHPDNPETGDLEEFLRLKQAYGVLSDPDRRMEYDALRQSRESGPMPIFQLKDFVTGVEAESNRRLGVLALLYNQRRTSPEFPGISLLDLEIRMSFPREYLSFTLWFLRSKSLVTMADNSDYAITSDGVEFVEKKSARSDLLVNLLKPGASQTQPRSKMARPRTKRSGAPKQFLLGTPVGSKVD